MEGSLMKSAEEERVLTASQEARHVLAAVYQVALTKTAAVSQLIEEQPSVSDDGWEASSQSAHETSEGTPDESQSESQGQSAADLQEKSVAESRGEPSAESQGECDVSSQEEYLDDDWEDDGASAGEIKKGSFEGRNSEDQLKADMEEETAESDVDIPHISVGHMEEPSDAPAQCNMEREMQASDAAEAEEVFEVLEESDNELQLEVANSVEVEDRCDILAEPSDKANVQAVGPVEAEEACNALLETDGKPKDKPKELQPQQPASRPSVHRFRAHHRETTKGCRRLGTGGFSMTPLATKPRREAAQLRAAEARLQDWHMQREAIKQAELERRLALEEEKEVQKQQLKCYLKSQQRCLEEAIWYRRGRGGQKTGQTNAKADRWLER
mmetsp:Transcript_58875/g.137096  ORF Transcript_58875/g.137096 Transcript_58875/m.137096 type:complete len:385 (+) Transcript_58875:242-1396(+)